MKKAKYITAIAAAMLLAGCIADKNAECGGESRSDVIRVRLTVPSVGAATRAAQEEPGVGAENSLRDIVVMVFGSTADATGTLETCERFVLASLPPEQDRWEAESTLLVGNVANLAQPKNVYVIANWNGYAAANYTAGTTTESVLLAEISSISAPLAAPAAASPMLMSGRVANYVFADNSNRATVGMARQAAKIRLSVSFDGDWTDFYGGRLVVGGAAGDERMRAVNVPDRSYVVGKNPPATPSSAGTLHYPFAGAMETRAAFLADSCYVFENPVQGNTATEKERAVSLLLNVPYVLDGTPNSNNYYRIYIDNAAEDAANPYSVLRNHIYDLKVTVKGFGLPEELAVPDALESEMTVEPWDSLSFDTDLDTDDAGGNIDGTVDPWNPNGGGSGGVISPPDPETEIDDADGGATIDPWDPNKGGTDL